MSALIDPVLLRRIKSKMKQPGKREQVKQVLLGLSSADLQNRAKVRSVLRKVGELLQEPLTASQLEHWSSWILAQRINPQNKLQLLRLWRLFS